MWICLSNAFLSIVEPKEGSAEDLLLVRARRAGDIQNVFPTAKVRRTPSRDYLFRALIPREEVARVVAARVTAINYPNFKASVRSKPLHDAFMRIWSIMSGLQPTAPYSGRRGRVGRQQRLPIDTAAWPE